MFRTLYDIIGFDITDKVFYLLFRIFFYIRIRIYNLPIFLSIIHLIYRDIKIIKLITVFIDIDFSKFHVNFEARYDSSGDLKN